MGSFSFPTLLPGAEEIESILFRHIIDVWFPRSLDVDYGGFLCHFNRQWQAQYYQEKLLEFQARQTMFLSEVSLMYPEHLYLKQAMLHGYQFLQKTWNGAWAHLLNRSGEPLEFGTKHVHGIAYAIQACTAVHKVQNDLGALDLALQGFEWLENYAHDDEHQGYYGFFQHDGTRIQNTNQWHTDTIGTPIGFKDINIHGDLLEAFTCLYELSDLPKIALRLQELIEIISQKVCRPSGLNFHFFYENWDPYEDAIRFGYGFQLPYRLQLACQALGIPDQHLHLSHQLLHYGLNHAWDPQQGGFFSTPPKPNPNNRYPIKPLKPWWINFEALRALLFMHELDPGYSNALMLTWNYIRTHFFDEEYQGVYYNSFSPTDDGMLDPEDTCKGSLWKDCSHEGRTLLYWLSLFK